jgi:flagellar hook protein FlgE
MTISALGTGLGAALSGLQAFQRAVDITANNVANANTAGFKPQSAQFKESTPSGSGVSLSNGSAGAGVAADPSAPSGTDLSNELVDLLIYKVGFQASAKAVKTTDGTLGSLLDTKS